MNYDIKEIIRLAEENAKYKRLINDLLLFISHRGNVLVSESGLPLAPELFREIKYLIDCADKCLETKQNL